MRQPLAVFHLPICTSRHHRSRKKLRVVIWKHVKDLRAAAKEIDSSMRWSDCAGCYLATRIQSFGQIHLWIKLIGAGYFAHELQHFMNDYSEETENYPLDPQANERMAFLAGDLTARFWIKFYEHFDVQPGIKS